MHENRQVSRRHFLGSAAALIAAAGLAKADQPANQGYPLVIPGYFGSRPGIQLGTQLPAMASEDDMKFARQLDVEWVMTSLPPQESTLSDAKLAS